VLVAVQVSNVGLYLPPVFRPPLRFPPPHIIISLPVHTAVRVSRASGALTVVVAVQVSSVQSSGENSGRLYPTLFAFVVTVVRFPVKAAVSAADKLFDAGDTPATTVRSSLKRSANADLARHSAMTKGSLPSAANNSRNISGRLVCWAIRSISA
jgi:hypothetical protein